jgi:hypothetical protein
MAERVDIYNAALGRVGQGTELASAEESGVAANELRRAYPIARAGLFADFPWSWCSRTVTATTYAAPPPGAAFAYEVPSGWAEVRKLHVTFEETAEALPWRLGGVTDDQGIDRSLVLSDLEGFYLTGTRIVTAEALYPAPFADVLAWRLAWHIAMPLARDPNVRVDMWRQYLYWLDIARSHDQRQRVQVAIEAEAIRGRV